MSCCEEETEESNNSEDGHIWIGTDHKSDSDSNDSLVEAGVENVTVQNRVKGRRDMRSKDLDIGDLLSTSIF